MITKFYTLIVEFRTVSPSGSRSCLNSQMQTLVPSSFCGKLMDYNWRKQVRSVHLRSWLTPQESNYVSLHLSCITVGYSATDNTDKSIYSIYAFHCLFNDWSSITEFTASSAVWSLSCRYCRGHLIFGDKLHCPRKSRWKKTLTTSLA